MFRLMSNRALLLAVLGLFMATAMLQAHDRGKGKPGNGTPARSKVEGTISAIGASSVTITKRSGASVTVNVDASTKLERNDLHVSFSAFKVGDHGEAVFNTTTLLASKVEATGP